MESSVSAPLAGMPQERVSGSLCPKNTAACLLGNFNSGVVALSPRVQSYLALCSSVLIALFHSCGLQGDVYLCGSPPASVSPDLSSCPETSY